VEDKRKEEDLRSQFFYRVYFYYPVNSRTFRAGETMAVSEEKAINNVRWNVFGELSVERLMKEKGIVFVAARAGTKKDRKFRGLPTEADADLIDRPSRRRRECQTYFSGPGFAATEPSRRR